MKITSLKTHKITPKKDYDLLKILDQYLPQVKEGSIVVIASKIVAITQGRVAKLSPQKKDQLIKKEADYFIPKSEHKNNLIITINKGFLTYSSGIDESNGNGFQILWPQNPDQVANHVRAYLKKRFKLKKVGVIITDMTALPLRWGVMGGAIGFSGFKPLKDLTDTPDIFGRKFKFTKVGILNGLAAAAAVVMGEGNEQTPIGIIEDIPFVQFQDSNPTKKELKSLIITPEEDLYGPLFKNVTWQKGGTK